MIYSVPKISVEVTAVMTAGKPRTGVAFLAEIAKDHSGPERLEEMLNQSENFFPLASKGGFALLNKRHLVYLTTTEATEIEYYQNLQTVARRENVRLMLRGRKTLGGILLVEMPEGRARVQDYLNSRRAFLPLLVGKRLALVNASTIVSLTPAPARAAGRAKGSSRK